MLAMELGGSPMDRHLDTGARDEVVSSMDNDGGPGNVYAIKVNFLNLVCVFIFPKFILQFNSSMTNSTVTLSFSTYVSSISRSCSSQ